MEARGKVRGGDGRFILAPNCQSRLPYSAQAVASTPTPEGEITSHTDAAAEIVVSGIRSLDATSALAWYPLAFLVIRGM